MLTERLQAAIDRQVEGSPRALELLQLLNGRSLRVEVRYTPWVVTLRASAERLTLDRSTGSADAHLSGTALSLLALARETPADVIRRGDVTITGDGGVAERFQQLIQLLRPDLEEVLSRVIGDVPAHGLGQLLRRSLRFGRDSARTVAGNVGEYLAHERRELVPRAEAQAYLDEVDQLRERVDRLAARVDALAGSGRRA